LLLAAGVYLLSHLGSDFGRIADHVMRTVELDPRRPFLHRIIVRLHRLHAGTLLVTGVAAIGYGLLELVEGVGLWLDQLWAEYLTVIATSLLIPVELYELARKPSIWKAGGIAVNVASSPIWPGCWRDGAQRGPLPRTRVHHTRHRHAPRLWASTAPTGDLVRMGCWPPEAARSL